MRKDTQEFRERVCEENEGVFPNYFERRLVIENNQFVIVPNGGTGDCLFKAIAQAISEEDDETKHLEIRCQIVDYIVQNIWEKLRDSIEIQHVTGNADLIEEWFNDPIKTYTSYMTTQGNLGSFIELTAAAELLQFNFASIQEYSSNVKTYRVENFSSRNFHHRPIFHFLFTGDYESGHWEHLVPLRPIHEGNGLVDGTYSGSLYFVVDGVQTSIEDWNSEMEERNRRFKNCQEYKTSETGSDASGGDESGEDEDSNPEMETTSGSGRDEESTMSHYGSGGEDTNYESSSHPQHDIEKIGSRLIETDDETTYIKKNIYYQSPELGDLRVSTKGSDKKLKSATSTLDNSTDLFNAQKKKGCLRSIVSYVSSILR